MQQTITKLYKAVEQHCEGDSTGHDWWHIYRVVRLALRIGKEENANLELVEIASLLHDLDDWKLSADSGNYPNARNLLKENNFDQHTIDRVIEIVEQVSFKGAGVDTTPRCIEAKVVQDADRLDAIGAIGIARTFAYGGAKGRAIYTPDVKPQMHQSFEEYKKSGGHTINHFYEKLLLLKDRMNTETAKEIATERHKFMQLFLDQFYKEWNI
ncbi:MAG: HD domain-containing protein [Bacteroidales bacterium]|nr:HD domain-containing protein [Bacteroidales bacterium]